ncbi:phage tail protein [Bacillus pfraonensis]
MQLKAYLENAYKIKYNPPLNEVWTAGFSLPYDDMKRKEIDTFDFVEIFDNGKRIGMFRVMDSVTERDEEKKIITYDCEHVLSTLMDSVLFGLHQRVNLPTRDNIEYLLSKQKTKHWQLGACQFTRYFHYNWENESTLLGPLFSIPKPFDQRYQWTWDDSTYPWTLHLMQVTDEITAEIRYRKNMKGIKRYIESKEVMTRIYPLGYGEGVNQLTIKDVNGGVPYIDAPFSILEQYEGFEYIWADRRFKDPKALYDSAKALLLERCVPKVTYEVDAIDYELIDPYKLEKFRTGKLVRVIDEELGVKVDVRVMSHSKDDADGNPLAVKLVLANKLEDLGTTQADLEKRQKVNEVYSQGSTNMDSSSFSDNCDSKHPAVIKFYLPEDVVNINSMMLSYETSAFRAFERATKGGGATTVSSSAGGANVSSTSAGGANVSSTSSGGGTVGSTSAGGASVQTSSSGGGIAKSTASGGSSTQTSSSGGGSVSTTSSKIFGEMQIETSISTGGDLENHRHTTTFTDQFNHNHSVNVPSHTHSVSVPSHTHNFDIPDHSHTTNIPDHAHSINIPNHTHEVTIPNHTHTVEIPNHTHEVTIPDHIHEIDFGIYELNRTPSSIKITVDGNVVPITDTSKENIDIIPYLSKDTDGKINRGRWVEIKLTPNDLARITATVNSRLFISSNIGGNF